MGQNRHPRSGVAPRAAAPAPDAPAERRGAARVRFIDRSQTRVQADEDHERGNGWWVDRARRCAVLHICNY